MVTPLVSLQQGNVKKFENSIKIVYIEGENLHIFWKTSMKFFRKDVGYDNVKITKKQGFTLSLSLSLSLSHWKRIFGEKAFSK